VVVSEPDSEIARIYREIARKVWDQISAQKADTSRAMPSIVFE
jgi:ATP-binding protein involved in chromosome partitioning